MTQARLEGVVESYPEVQEIEEAVAAAIAAQGRETVARAEYAEWHRLFPQPRPQSTYASPREVATVAEDIRYWYREEAEIRYRLQDAEHKAKDARRRVASAIREVYPYNEPPSQLRMGADIGGRRYAVGVDYRINFSEATITPVSDEGADPRAGVLRALGEYAAAAGRTEEAKSLRASASLIDADTDDRRASAQ